MCTQVKQKFAVGDIVRARASHSITYPDTYRVVSLEDGDPCIVRVDGGLLWTNQICCTEWASWFELVESAEKSKALIGTTVPVKLANFDTFAGLIKKQFEHGGDKYKLEGFEDMEATDLICRLWEKPGPDELKWLLKTVIKYIFRFQNFHREKDLLKIATYCYIAWLKMGFHKEEKHDEDTKA